jgi:hypothetical protein
MNVPTLFKSGVSDIMKFGTVIFVSHLISTSLTNSQMLTSDWGYKFAVIMGGYLTFNIVTDKLVGLNRGKKYAKSVDTSKAVFISVFSELILNNSVMGSMTLTNKIISTFTAFSFYHLFVSHLAK